MQVTLSTGVTFDIAALKLSQVRRMNEAVEAGKPMDATTQACLDSINNAQNGIIGRDGFEDSITVPEVNELFGKVMEVSGLKAGETTASA